MQTDLTVREVDKHPAQMPAHDLASWKSDSSVLRGAILQVSGDGVPQMLAVELVTLCQGIAPGIRALAGMGHFDPGHSLLQPSSFCSVSSRCLTQYLWPRPWFCLCCFHSTSCVIAQLPAAVSRRVRDKEQTSCGPYPHRPRGREWD